MLTPNRLSKLDFCYEVIRPNSVELIKKSLLIIKTWLNYQVPHDMTKVERAEKLLSNCAKDYLQYEFPIKITNNLDDYPESVRKTLFAAGMNLFKNRFEKNKFSLLKYAARREVSPIMPKTNNPNHGLTCCSSIILPLQIACIQQYVQPLKDKWISDKKFPLSLLDNYLSIKSSTQGKSYLDYLYAMHSENTNNNYDTALSLLTKDLEQINFAVIPPGLRLDAKFCPANIIHQSLCDDIDNFNALGKLSPPQGQDVIFS